MDNTVSVGGSYAGANASVGYNFDGSYVTGSFGVGVPLAPTTGGIATSLGYGWTFGPDGIRSAGLSLNISARQRLDEQSPTNRAINEFADRYFLNMQLGDERNVPAQNWFTALTGSDSLLRLPDVDSLAGHLVNAALLPPRIAGGLLLSALNGDLWSDAPVYRTSFDTHARGYLMTINGIFTNNNDADQNLADTRRALGGEFDATSSTRVQNDTTLFGAGDLLQILGHEFGLIDITAIRAARQANAMAEFGRQNGLTGTYIHVLAHSQGTEVFLRSLSLMSPETRASIDYHGYGPEATIGLQHGLGHVENVWNQGDPVPHLGRLNLIKNMLENDAPVRVIQQDTVGLSTQRPFVQNNGDMDFIRHTYHTNYRFSISPNDLHH